MQICWFDYLTLFSALKLQIIRSRDSEDAINPGNNLYVTGLSTRVTETDLEKYFNREGKVCFFMYFIINISHHIFSYILVRLLILLCALANELMNDIDWECYLPTEYVSILLKSKDNFVALCSEFSCGKSMST